MDLKKYAYTRQKNIVLKTDGVKLLLEITGNPDKKMKIVHVSGTNGKGSVCAFLREGFIRMGLKTGGFTSPELFDITDAITVDNKPISTSALESVYGILSLSVEKVYAKTGKMPSQFEINFVAAMLWFERCGCEIAVIECGMGGKGDATNAISDSAVSVITHIALDHCKYLGNTLDEITENKCGIFKDKSVIVTGFQDTRVMNKIIDCAKSRRIITAKRPVLRGFYETHEIFDYDGIKGLLCSLSGKHQTENAATAIEVLRLFGADENIIFDAILNTKHRARFEKLKDNIYFDGAHNPNGFASFIKNINRYKMNGHMIFILGFMADKDVRSCIKYMDNLENRDFEIYTFRVRSNRRSETGEGLSAICADCGYTAEIFDDVNTAIEKAKEHADVIFIAGSLYTYKELANLGKDLL